MNIDVQINQYVSQPFAQGKKKKKTSMLRKKIQSKIDSLGNTMAFVALRCIVVLEMALVCANSPIRCRGLMKSTLFGGRWERVGKGESGELVLLAGRLRPLIGRRLITGVAPRREADTFARLWEST